MGFTVSETEVSPELSNFLLQPKISAENERVMNSLCEKVFPTSATRCRLSTTRPSLLLDETYTSIANLEKVSKENDEPLPLIGLTQPSAVHKDPAKKDASELQTRLHSYEQELRYQRRWILTLLNRQKRFLLELSDIEELDFKLDAALLAQEKGLKAYKAAIATWQDMARLANVNFDQFASESACRAAESSNPALCEACKGDLYGLTPGLAATRNANLFELAARITTCPIFTTKTSKIAKLTDNALICSSATNPLHQISPILKAVQSAQGKPPRICVLVNADRGYSVAQVKQWIGQHQKASSAPGNNAGDENENNRDNEDDRDDGLDSSSAPDGQHVLVLDAARGEELLNLKCQTTLRERDVGVDLVVWWPLPHENAPAYGRAGLRTQFGNRRFVSLGLWDPRRDARTGAGVLGELEREMAAEAAALARFFA